MFEIDLKESSKPTSSRSSGSEILAKLRPFLPVAGALLALLGVLWMADRRIDGDIRERQENVATLETSLATSRQQLAELSGKARVLYEKGETDIYWSDELRMISEKLSDKIWLTQVRAKAAETTKGPNGEVVTPGGVLVEGGVLSSSNEGNLDVIGKLIADLQADPRFQQSFASIKLDSVQRSADPLTLNFSLRLTLKG